MRIAVRVCLYLLLAFPLGSAVAQASVPGEMLGPIDCPAGGGVIDRQGFVRFGGIDQWVTITGADCRNPLILIVHGGPGNPLTPYENSGYASWSSDFIVVHWDQRGAGRTFGRNPPGEGQHLTIDRMADDGVELAGLVTRALGKDKAYLVAASWGSVLGVHMAKARPDLFHAYVGLSQLVSHRDNLAASYARTLEKARAANDAEVVAQLEHLGAPPWSNPRGFGILRRATRRYEAPATTPGPAAWWEPAAAYASAERREEYVAGEDYSYLEFVGLEGDGMLSRVDLPKLGTRFEVPIFFIQGAEDLVTVPEVSKRYFDSVDAPHKDYVLIARGGHDPNAAMMDAAFEILKGHAPD